jgi:hypothetical protein
MRESNQVLQVPQVPRVPQVPQEQRRREPPVRIGSFVVIALLALLAVAGCGRSEPSPADERVAVTRRVGSWQGRGNSTIGVNSDTGRFHISWQARNERPSGGGTFRLAVHSAVSGRPIQLITEQRGEGSGSADFQDDPRPYNLMIDSANLDWSVSVDEVVVATRPAGRHP